MSYTYNSFVLALANEMVVNPTGSNFLLQLPTIIDQAEQQIYRDVDLLSTVIRDSSATLSAMDRNFTLPSGQGRFVTVTGMNVMTPAGATDMRNPMVLQSRDVVDFFWPSDLTTALPTMYAMITDQDLIVGPSPDAGYNVEVIGTIRPLPLSDANQTTFLSLYLSDLFFAATMIAAAAYQKNFGAVADDPKMAVTWQSNYDARLASASLEEMRKRWGSTTWTAKG